MKPLLTSAAVLLGYAAAVLAACAAVYVRQLGESSIDVQASGGMYAFGDAILFAAVFGVVAIVPTGLALYSLRGVRTFWPAFSIAALTLAVASVMARFVIALTSSRPLDHAMWAVSVLLAFLLVWAAPLLAVVCLLSALIAPTRRCRWVLIVAALVTALVGLPSFLWIVSHRLL